MRLESGACRAGDRAPLTLCGCSGRVGAASAAGHAHTGAAAAATAEGAAAEAAAADQACAVGARRGGRSRAAAEGTRPATAAAPHCCRCRCRCPAAPDGRRNRRKTRCPGCGERPSALSGAGGGLVAALHRGNGLPLQRAHVQGVHGAQRSAPARCATSSPSQPRPLPYPIRRVRTHTGQEAAGLAGRLHR
jgi:hypothetical protein